jgi:diphosphoinositol-polyphosphate diphosphatase
MSGLNHRARTGRHTQRYETRDGVKHRLVVGAIPYMPSTSTEFPQILLVNSKKYPDEWLFPKGGWEDDETDEECALREAWEESGCVGSLGDRLIKDEVIAGGKENQLHSYYLLEVSILEENWPEKNERGRKWFSPLAVKELFELQERRKDRLAQLDAIEKFIQHFAPV